MLFFGGKQSFMLPGRLAKREIVHFIISSLQRTVIRTRHMPEFFRDRGNKRCATSNSRNMLPKSQNLGKTGNEEAVLANLALCKRECSLNK